MSERVSGGVGRRSLTSRSWGIILARGTQGAQAFYDCFSSLAEQLAAARSGQGRAVFWRGDSASLTARTAATSFAKGRKSRSTRMHDDRSMIVRST
jgi:hypothetical protein